MARFQLVSDFAPTGDQPQAIEALVKGLRQGLQHQVLLGVTGSGKTFSIANVVQELQRPTLVMAHNKTLAAQLYREFKELFPHNAVEYFVSYYDYYQPEAYMARTDTYIAKESHINEEIDRLRHSATRATMERRDTLIVASVSCIFGMGNPANYREMSMELEVGQEVDRDRVVRRLVELQYVRESYDFYRGNFRLRGDTLELFPASEAARVLRIVFFGDVVESIQEVDPMTSTPLGSLEKALVLANSHYVTPADVLQRGMDDIRQELKTRVEELHHIGKPHHAERLEQRTLYDLEMLEISGFCSGIENYSRHMDGRKVGEPPWTLLDYFPKDFLCVVDESHVAIPQIGGMFKGDRARKQSLVNYGFRLPSALDNRPLTFEEWQQRVGQRLYISATPGDWEMKQADGAVVEQIVRPTGLLDPVIDVRPAINQVEDLMPELRARAQSGQRSLVATLTKRMAEDLTEFIREQGISAAYLHSDIDTMERMELLHALRAGEYDVLVGINLLREGLDLPEVSLVAVLDADKEGFLRAERSLIQVSGRAARNVDGLGVMYADKETKSIRKALSESSRRRELQMSYNIEHGIVPRTIEKPLMPMPRLADKPKGARKRAEKEGWRTDIVEGEIASLTKEMKKAARKLDFERAAELRDAVKELTDLLITA